MTAMLDSSRAQLQAAKQFGARIKVATEYLDYEARARHVLILNTNGYRALARAIKAIPNQQLPRAITLHQVKRGLPSGEAEEKQRSVPASKSRRLSKP